MQKTTVIYHLVVDTKLNGSYYVGYVNVGGGVNEFTFDKNPVKQLFDKNIALHYRELLSEVIDDGGNLLYKDEFITIDDSFNFKDITEIKIQKQTVTTNIEFEYI